MCAVGFFQSKANTHTHMWQEDKVIKDIGTHFWPWECLPGISLPTGVGTRSVGAIAAQCWVANDGGSE